MLVLLDQLGLDCMMKMGNRRESLHIYIYIYVPFRFSPASESGVPCDTTRISLYLF